MTARKYQRGDRFTSTPDVIVSILNKEVIFENHKPQTWGWTQNWSIRSIDARVQRGRLFRALPNEGDGVLHE